ncbi:MULTISPECIES: 50S ribosomal protein L1 [Oceanithermus]|uniref:Large ribosomal subunit protein uL1 n=2 Tax=Oceanithermus desulfurans TaxID=227924 RepID=A0A511RKE7_9DEIN|nr:MULTISPECIES: 50S ribosomal protein L1 [Oceanithermus]MBB6030699.1 large subunit ribosomal protein L1 [Oceanithermus desulfurans]GEM89422.1 50S ribosomal protein L1 [Oceanithermus desulfurans NBRC 100063]
MPKHGKRYRALLEKIDPNKVYTIDEAAKAVKELASARFDESVEAHIKLGIDPRKSDQNVRSTVALPHGTGKQVRVLAIAKGEKIKEAEEAGADYVGGEEMVQKILDGWMDFDAVVATPDMMGAVGSKLGRVLGPRGLLPNPKAGTVGFNIGEIVKQIKAGRIEFRNDKTGVVHAPVGKASFEPEKIADNVRAFIKAVEQAKPEGAKGTYLKSVYLTTTMGPSIKVDPHS